MSEPMRPDDDRPDWDAASSWPHRALSRFVRAGALTWHLQRSAKPGAPRLLCLHGTGASAHSFANVLPVLAADHDVLMPDLPGHGFTSSAPSGQLNLAGMASATARLLKACDWQPDIIIGHSAGAAIAIWMAMEGLAKPDSIIGFNAALKPIQGNAVLSPMAKLLFVNPLTPRLFALQARYLGVADTLIKATNTPLPDADRARYRLLMENPAHVHGALGMMANWNLEPLQERLPFLETPLLLVAAEDDRMVPPSVSRHAAGRAAHGRYLGRKNGGHLLHEIEPQSVLDAVLRIGREAGTQVASLETHDPKRLTATQ